MSSLADVFERYGTITVEEMDAIAQLRTRTDRKYVVTPELCHQLAVAFADRLDVVSVGDERQFAYESTYFDTPSLQSFHGAARRRRRRYKVRTRRYSGSGDSMLEVKIRTGREETDKRRVPLHGAHDGPLATPDHAFIASVVEVDGGPEALRPTAETAYRRTSAVDRSSRARITFDETVSCQLVGGPRVHFAGVVVETKTAGPASAVDRWLWREGNRPVPLSKYCTGLAALSPELPRHPWHRTIARHVSATEPAS